MAPAASKDDSERLLAGHETPRLPSLSAAQLCEVEAAALMTPRSLRPLDDTAPTLKQSRLLAALVLPLLMIAMTILIEKQHVADANASLLLTSRENAAALQLANHAFLNRTCPLVRAHSVIRPRGWENSGSEGQRVLIGAGFPGAGLTALTSTLLHLPTACSPARNSQGFWSSLGAMPSHSSVGRRVLRWV